MTASKVASKDSLFHCRFTAGDSIFFTRHTLVLVLVLVLSYQLWALLSLTPRGLAPPNQREKKGARAPISWLHLRGPEGQRAAGTTSASPQGAPRALVSAPCRLCRPTKGRRERWQRKGRTTTTKCSLSLSLSSQLPDQALSFEASQESKPEKAKQKRESSLPARARERERSTASVASTAAKTSRPDEAPRRSKNVGIAYSCPSVDDDKAKKTTHPALPQTRGRKRSNFPDRSRFGRGETGKPEATERLKEAILVAMSRALVNAKRRRRK